MKLSADGSILSADERAILERDSTNALAAVNGFHYQALRMYSWPIWPEAGEIRDALDCIDKLPLYELHEMRAAAGFSKDE